MFFSNIKIENVGMRYWLLEHARQVIDKPIYKYSWFKRDSLNWNTNIESVTVSPEVEILWVREVLTALIEADA